MRSNFENLRVYRLAEDISDRIWDLVSESDAFARNTMGSQLVRAADSVGANIAEGEGRGSYADNRRFVRTARGSLNETKHFLRRAYRRRLLKSEDVNALKPWINELGPKLNSYLKSVGRTTTDPNQIGNRSAAATDN
jgi:four helix bundle protein